MKGEKLNEWGFVKLEGKVCSVDPNRWMEKRIKGLNN